MKADYKINESQDLVELIALKVLPEISAEDVKSANRLKNTIEYRLTMKGAKKWADLTGRSKNKLLAFVFNYKIISLTKVNAKMNSGAALVKIDDEELLNRIEKLFN